MRLRINNDINNELFITSVHSNNSFQGTDQRFMCYSSSTTQPIETNEYSHFRSYKSMMQYLGENYSEPGTINLIQIFQDEDDTLIFSTTDYNTCLGTATNISKYGVELQISFVHSELTE